jgi:hypothetical protein
MTGIRVQISLTRSFGFPVMIVQVWTHSSFAGFSPTFPESGENERRIVLHFGSSTDSSLPQPFSTRKTHRPESDSGVS